MRLSRLCLLRKHFSLGEGGLICVALLKGSLFEVGPHLLTGLNITIRCHFYDKSRISPARVLWKLQKMLQGVVGSRRWFQDGRKVKIR